EAAARRQRHVAGPVLAGEHDTLEPDAGIEDADRLAAHHEVHARAGFGIAIGRAAHIADAAIDGELAFRRFEQRDFNAQLRGDEPARELRPRRFGAGGAGGRAKAVIAGKPGDEGRVDIDHTQPDPAIDTGDAGAAGDYLAAIVDVGPAADIAPKQAKRR